DSVQPARRVDRCAEEGIRGATRREPSNFLRPMFHRGSTVDPRNSTVILGLSQLRTRMFGMSLFAARRQAAVAGQVLDLLVRKLQEAPTGNREARPTRNGDDSDEEVMRL